MTKVYLVCSRECISTGTIDMKTNETVMHVFTNRKLADRCINYLNQEWKLGFVRNADFKEEKLRYFYRKTMIIEREDYGKLPF